MDKIDLPCIDANAKLNKAIKLMKDNGRSAVLVELPSGPKVLDVDLILHTLREKGDVQIGTIKPRLATVRLSDQRLSERAYSTNNHVDRIDVQKQMDSRRAAYVVVSISGTTAHILTRHETFSAIVGFAPSMWRCRTDPDHVWLTVDLIQPGNKCRDDGSSVDAV